MRRPRPLAPVPVETARVARAAFPRGHPYIRTLDALGGLSTDDGFAALVPARGQPDLAPWRLALATIPRFAEGPSDVRSGAVARLDLTAGGPTSLRPPAVRSSRAGHPSPA